MTKSINRKLLPAIGILLVLLTGCENRTETVFALQGDGFRLSVSDKGVLAVEMNGETYRIESEYSYPGDTIGTNRFAVDGQAGEWNIAIQAGETGSERVQIIGKGKYYTLRRMVSAVADRIKISDELTNETNEALGVLIKHRVLTGKKPAELLFAGAPWKTGKGIGGAGKDLARRIFSRLGFIASEIGFHAENPSLFVSGRRSNLGVIAEDSLSRLQFEAHRYRAAFSLKHFALRPQATQTFEWALYPLPGAADYYGFINKVRRDWQTNFTIEGPWDFFDLVDREDLLEQPERLKEYLGRKRLRVVAFRPWLDYDHFNWRSGKTVGREEYKQLIRKGMAAFKAADPAIKCLGCMTSNWLSPPTEIMERLYEKIPPEGRIQGIHRFSDEQMRIVAGLLPVVKKSFMTAENGRHIYELYYNGPNKEPLTAVGAYAAEGNAQFAHWMAQARFMMEEVGLDGVYIDAFSLAFNADPPQRYSHDEWDGVTVDINGKTGRIVRRYTDCAMVGEQVQKKLIQYIRSRAGLLVANTAASVREVQALPAMRFVEGAEVMHTFHFREGEKPPLVRHLCRAQLGSPIALGWRPHEYIGEDDKPEYARKVMQTAIMYLRHGLLYYYYGHYGLRNLEGGPFPAEYGAINHMFPITPVRIGEGFVEGKERIVTAVSGQFSWSTERKPLVLCFDMASRPLKVAFDLHETQQGRQITIKLNDWKEICIVE